MFNIGMGEVIFIALLILIFIGPDRLPKIMRQVGAFTYQVRQIIREINTEFAEELRPLQEIRGLADDLNPTKQIGTLLGTEQLLDGQDAKSGKTTTTSQATASDNPMSQISRAQSGDYPVDSHTIAPPEAVQPATGGAHPMSQISQAKMGGQTAPTKPAPPAEAAPSANTGTSPMDQISQAMQAMPASETSEIQPADNPSADSAPDASS